MKLDRDESRSPERESARKLTLKPLVALGATALTVPLLMAWRDYPWHLALAAGFAVGFLAFFALRTLEELRRQIRR